MATKKLKKLLGDAGAGIDKSHGSDRLYDVLYAVVAELEELRSAFNTHTHRGDGSEGGEYNTSMPQSDAEDISQQTAVEVSQGVENE